MCNNTCRSARTPKHLCKCSCKGRNHGEFYGAEHYNALPVCTPFRVKRNKVWEVVRLGAHSQTGEKVRQFYMGLMVRTTGGCFFQNELYTEEEYLNEQNKMADG